MASDVNPDGALARSASPVRKRVMFLSTDMGMGGGAEEQVIRLAYGFQDRGWGTMIVSMLEPSPMPPDFAGRGIPLMHLGMRRQIPDPRSIPHLAKMIREFRPDVVHSHMPHANLLGRIVRLISPYPVLIGTLHLLTMAGVEHDHTRVFEIAHRLTDRLSERTTAICHAASNYYVQRGAVPAGKMMTVYNGIDSTRFAVPDDARERMRRDLGVENRFVWLAVGRLELAKAYPTLLRAFAKLGAAQNTLLICGQGSLDGELRLLAKELGIEDNVKFLGLRSDIPYVMSAADAFALSSDIEGLPLVLLQASAAGLPIVATDVGGNTEAVVDGCNGYVVPAGDPDSFAQAMLRILALSASDRANLGRAGQLRVQTLFEAERVIDRWEQLYNELLDGVGDVAGRSNRRTSAAYG